MCDWRVVSANRVGAPMACSCNVRRGSCRLEHSLPPSRSFGIDLGLDALCPDEHLVVRYQQPGAIPRGAAPRQERPWGGGGRSRRHQWRPDGVASRSAASGATLGVTVASGTVRRLKTSPRSSDRLLITMKGEPAPCHFNANPVRRVSAALSVTLQLGHTAPKLPRTTNVLRRHPGPVLRCSQLE